MHIARRSSRRGSTHQPLQQQHIHTTPSLFSSSRLRISSTPHMPSPLLSSSHFPLPIPYTQVRSTPRRIQQATKDHNHRLRTCRPTYPLTRHPRRGARRHRTQTLGVPYHHPPRKACRKPATRRRHHHHHLLTTPSNVGACPHARTTPWSAPADGA